MAPLDPNPARLPVLTLNVPVHVTRVVEPPMWTSRVERGQPVCADCKRLFRPGGEADRPCRHWLIRQAAAARSLRSCGCRPRWPPSRSPFPPPSARRPIASPPTRRPAHVLPGQRLHRARHPVGDVGPATIAIRTAQPRYWEPNLPRMTMHYPSGDAVVEMIPETSKLNINYRPSGRPVSRGPGRQRRSRPRPRHRRRHCRLALARPAPTRASTWGWLRLSSPGTRPLKRLKNYCWCAA